MHSIYLHICRGSRAAYDDDDDAAAALTCIIHRRGIEFAHWAHTLSRRARGILFLSRARTVKLEAPDRNNAGRASLPPPPIPSVTRMRIYARMGRWLLLLRADIKGLMRCKSTCSFSRSLSLSLWARIYRWATSLALGKRLRVRVDLRRYITRRVCAEVCKWRLRARYVWPCRRGATAALYVRAPIKGCWWREFVWTWPSCRFCFVVLIINSYEVFTVNG